MKEGVPPAALRQSLDVPRRLLRSRSAPSCTVLDALAAGSFSEAGAAQGAALVARSHDCDEVAFGAVSPALPWDVVPEPTPNEQGRLLVWTSNLHWSHDARSPASLAIQHTLDGGELSPATTALQQVYSDMTIVADKTGHWTAAGYGTSGAGRRGPLGAILRWGGHQK